MVSSFQEQESLLQDSIFDSLYCEEERLDEDLGNGFSFKEQEIEDFNEIHKHPFGFLFEHDLFWEDEEIVALLSKEKKQTHLSFDVTNSDVSLKILRNEAVKWMLKVISHYGFTAITAVLAVNYYDRFVASDCFQRDKPWMSQLAAVACLSLAAKMEETQVPLLLDLQVEESKYVFEARTTQRMELLILSTLQWKMNPVTPISFFDHIVRRFELVSNVHCEFLTSCESILISIINDCRFLCYLPSVIAAAIMKYVLRDIDPCNALEYENKLMSTLRTSKEKIDDCLRHIMEVTENYDHNLSRKRKHVSMPNSPSGVIDAYFSSDSSNDSWAVGLSLPTPLSKRSRTHSQHMRLASMSVAMANHPH